VSLILGTSFVEGHVQSLMPRKRLMVLSSGVSIPLVDNTRRSTSAFKLAKVYVVPPKTYVTVLFKADREGISLLKTLYVKGRLLYACNGVSCLPAPEECFLITIANFGDTFACMQPGTTLGVATDIEQVLLLDDDVDEKRDWRKEVPMDEVPESIREQALAIWSKHASMFDGRLSQIDSVSHRVKTTGEPIFQQPHRARPFSRTAEETEVNRMLAEDIIEPSTSEWSSPVVSAPKRDGGMLFCVDYRKLNSLTKRDVYPLPRLDECIYSLGDAVVFPTLDANSGYWQVSMHPDDRDRLHSLVMSAPSVSNVCRLGNVTHRQPSNVLSMSSYLEYAGRSVCATSMTSLSSRRQWKVTSKIWTKC
jgi:hypothetical protein